MLLYKKRLVLQNVALFVLVKAYQARAYNYER